jgi:uncharacterized protein
VSSSNTLWNWHLAKESMIAKKKEQAQLDQQVKQLLEQLRKAEEKLQAIPSGGSAPDPDQDIQRLMLEQEIWLASKELERFQAESQNKLFALEMAISEQQNVISSLEMELNEQTLSTYYRIAETKQRPIVEVKNKACTGCFLELTQNKVSEWRRGKELVHCDECGRILV